MKARIDFWVPVPGTDTATIEREVEYDSLDDAMIAFKALYSEYPTVMVPAATGFPNPAHRVEGNMSRYGKEIILYYWDDRQGGWYHPAMDKDGDFYVPAILENSKSVPGYGYMRSNEDRTPLPAGTIEGYYCVDTGRMHDPVQIDGLVVEQDEINRVMGMTGELPTHITHMDYSGSYLYIAEIVWGDESMVV